MDAKYESFNQPYAGIGLDVHGTVLTLIDKGLTHSQVIQQAGVTLLAQMDMLPSEMIALIEKQRK